MEELQSIVDEFNARKQARKKSWKELKEIMDPDPQFMPIKVKLSWWWFLFGTVKSIK